MNLDSCRRPEQEPLDQTVVRAGGDMGRGQEINRASPLSSGDGDLGM